MDKALRDYDDETVKDYKEDIDNLLTFVRDSRTTCFGSIC